MTRFLAVQSELGTSIMCPNNVVTSKCQAVLVIHSSTTSNQHQAPQDCKTAQNGNQEGTTAAKKVVKKVLLYCSQEGNTEPGERF